MFQILPRELVGRGGGAGSREAADRADLGQIAPLAQGALDRGDHVPARTIWRPHGNDKSARSARLALAQCISVLSTEAGREVWSYLAAVEWGRQRLINQRLGLYSGPPIVADSLDDLL